MGYGRKFRKPTLETVKGLAHKSYSSCEGRGRFVFIFRVNEI